MTNHYLSVIVFAPLVGALLCFLIGRKVRSEFLIGTIACASIGVSTVIAFIIAFTGAGGAALAAEAPVMSHLWTWMQVGSFRADFGFAMDRLSGIYACFITFIGLLIHIFATGYMHGDKSFYRFFAYLNLFMFMMLTLVLADNILLMFVGWEGVGLCSYLLIGYYVNRREAGDAAKKAFVANRIGDWGVILGIFFIFFLTSQAGAPSISFFNKTYTDGATTVSFLQTIQTFASDPFTLGAFVLGGVTSAAILLFIGATGKSAQIPLFVWLPDAMAGPTPVSALIHAATMVTAGVYMIVRCSELFVRAPSAMATIAIIGAATAIFAATIGLAQNDIKKVLAYSTVSQLGYMMLACGVGAFGAAIFHVMTHAFFKALLFLGSGSVIHGMHHEQDMRRMGNLRKYMPVTFVTMVTGWLAIAGIPIFAGFWSKDEILYRTFANQTNNFGLILWAIGLITAVITAIYMTRMMVMTFWGTDRWATARAGGQADEAHAHAYDEGLKSHDALTSSEGNRPHHRPGDEVTGASTVASNLQSASPHDAATPDATTHEVRGNVHIFHDADTSHDAHASHDDDDDEHAHHGLASGHKPHESPLVMTLPLIILAVLSVFGGLIGVPYAISSLLGLGDINHFEHTLHPALATAPAYKKGETLNGATSFYNVPATNLAPNAEAHSAVTQGAPHGTASPNATSHDAATHGTSHAATSHGDSHGATAAHHSPEEIRDERILAGVSILLAIMGIGIGWTVFSRNPLKRMPRLLEGKYFVDEIYNGTLVNPIHDLSRIGLWRIFDVGVVDGIVNLVGTAMKEAGDVARRLQAGFVRSYAAVILIGALIVIGYFAAAALAR